MEGQRKAGRIDGPCTGGYQPPLERSEAKKCIHKIYNSHETWEATACHSLAPCVSARVHFYRELLLLQTKQCNFIHLVGLQNDPRPTYVELAVLGSCWSMRHLLYASCHQQWRSATSVTQVHYFLYQSTAPIYLAGSCCPDAGQDGLICMNMFAAITLNKIPWS